MRLVDRQWHAKPIPRALTHSGERLGSDAVAPAPTRLGRTIAVLGITPLRSTQSRRSTAIRPSAEGIIVTTEQVQGIPPGWVGGFAESNPAFAYPNPDLTSLPLLQNMANIDLLDRQQAVLWPEFSWETVPGDPSSRCYQMFAPDISRIGYTDTGRIYSIICPQQGAYSPSLGCLNVEVSVTGQRGWVDETTRKMAADMTVEGKIWFSPSATQSPLVQLLWALFAGSDLPFPASKAHAIRVATHLPGDPSEPVVPGAAAGRARRFPSRTSPCTRRRGRWRTSRSRSGPSPRPATTPSTTSTSWSWTSSTPRREPAAAGQPAVLERLLHRARGGGPTGVARSCREVAGVDRRRPRQPGRQGRPLRATPTGTTSSRARS